MSQTETLQAELSEARAALVGALAEGADTTPHRQRIAELEAQIASLERQDREERAAASRAEAAAVEQAGAALSAESHAAVDAAAAVDGLAELTGEALPAVPEDPAIVAAAREVARCRATLSAVETALKPIADQAKMLAGRFGEKRAAIDQIKTRRLAGDERAGDAAELAMLQADSENLQLLADDARLKVQAADTRAAARAALANAEQQLEQARRQVEYRAALARVELAQEVFLNAFGVMVRAGRAAGQSSPWSAFKANPNLIRAATGQIVSGASNPFFN